MVNFPTQHWHADHRFLDFSRLNNDPRIYRHYKYFEQSQFCLENSAFRNPVIEIAPLNMPDDAVERHVQVSDLNPITYPEHAYLKLMILKYQSETPDSVFSDADYLPELTDQYRNKTLVEGRYCPHRRADLTSIPPDENGIVTCPLHRLRWCKATGQIAEPIPAVDFDQYYTDPKPIEERGTHEVEPVAASEHLVRPSKHHPHHEAN